MKKAFIESGKIVGTHGINGMVRIQPWCDNAEFLCSFKTLYKSDSGVKSAIEITTAKPHGNVVIAEIKDITTIEQAEKLRGHIVYINRSDLNLKDGQFLICDLIGCTVFDYESGNVLGKISDVSKTGANDIWHIENNGNEYLVPCINDVVKSVDIENEKVIIKPLDGIFD